MMTNYLGVWLKCGVSSGIRCCPMWKGCESFLKPPITTSDMLVEKVLLPLQTDPILSSLYRTPKIHRTTSPARQNGISSMSALNSIPHSSHIDVRTVALRSFRDNVILPLFPRLRARVSSPNRQD